MDDIINMVEHKPAVLYPTREHQGGKAGKKNAKQEAYLTKQFERGRDWSKFKIEDIAKTTGLTPSQVFKWKEEYLEKAKEA